MHKKPSLLIYLLFTFIVWPFNIMTGVLIEKNGITLDYEPVGYLGKEIQKNLLDEDNRLGIGHPHYLAIKNNTQTDYIINEQFIKSKLYSSEEVLSARYIHFLYNFIYAASVTGLCTMYWHDYSKKEGVLSQLMVFLSGGVAIAGGINLISCLAALAWDHETISELEKKMFMLPCRLAPGEEIKKVFWPKNCSGAVEFDMDAIQETPKDYTAQQNTVTSD